MHYSEYLLMKESDLATKNQRKKQRQQIADMLLYISRNGLNYRSTGKKQWVKRESVQRELQYTCHTCAEVNLGQLVSDVPYTDISIDDVYLNFSTGEDYDGYPEYYTELSVSTPELDFEYYETICNYLLPSNYQISLALQEREEYNTYLALKNKYEQGGINAS